MPGGKGLTYQDAGVNIDLTNQLEDSYFALMRSTYGPAVIHNDGGYAGLLRLKGVEGLFARRLQDPILVSGADGVGTKLKIAFLLDKHDTVGIDLVAMSANDILVQGAEPLFFLDYIGIGRADKRVLFDIVKGVAEGCRQAGCALLGGETAELPGFYADGEYDLAGFAVGVVERRHLITGARIKPGDVILGLASSGLHANGYSLARKILLEIASLRLEEQIPELGCTLGEELLRPTRIYCQAVLSILHAYRRKRPVHGLAHITGGGMIENIPRILPKHCDALIRIGSWPTPPIFSLIQRCGKVPDEEMRHVFNMGVGMIMVVARSSAAMIKRRCRRLKMPAYTIGEIVAGEGRVKMVG